MKQLKPQDAQFLYMETENNLSNATMLCVYAPPKAGKASFDPYAATLQQLDKRLHTSTIFTHHIKHVKANLDYPYWVIDPYFQLQNHIFKVEAAAPGDWQVLADITAAIHSRPLDLRRPPWEIHVVSGLDGMADAPTGSFALVVKMHHAAIDGSSAMRFFQALHDRSANPKAEDPGLAMLLGDSHPDPSTKVLVKNAAKNYLNSPIRAVQTLLRQLRSLPEKSTEADVEGSKRSPVPKTRFNAAVGPQKNFSAVTLPLAQLKLLRTLSDGATLNDVILAICGGALHRYLKQHESLPNTSLVAWVPVNIREAHNQDEDGNNISAMAIKIASQYSDPLERLQQICWETREAKSGRAGLAARMVTDLTQHMPSTGMAALTRLLLASNMTSKMCNLAISNVPGPNFPLFLKGAECLKQYGMVPLGEGMGLFVVAMSYNQQLSLSITSTETILPDIAFFTHCLEQEYEALSSLVAAEKSR